MRVKRDHAVLTQDSGQVCVRDEIATDGKGARHLTIDLPKPLVLPQRATVWKRQQSFHIAGGFIG